MRKLGWAVALLVVAGGPARADNDPDAPRRETPFDRGHVGL